MYKLAILAALIVVLIVSADTLKANYVAATTFSYCENPLTYKIGEIDAEFRISRDELLENTETAAQVWNSAYDSELFTYKEDGEVTIHLKFDQRQRQLRNIRQQQVSLEAREQELGEELDEFEASQLSLKSQIDDLNAEILDWNGRGGAPADVLQQLNAEREQLLGQIEVMERRAQEINGEIAQLNSQINQFNSDVELFNQLLEVSPEQGIYYPDRKTIEIFFYEDATEYIHTMAHEFGHALGMDHIDTTNAIMHPLINNTLEVTSADLALLQDICAERSIFTELSNQLSTAFTRFSESE